MYGKEYNAQVLAALLHLGQSCYYAKQYILSEKWIHDAISMEKSTNYESLELANLYKWLANTKNKLGLKSQAEENIKLARTIALKNRIPGDLYKLDEK